MMGPIDYIVVGFRGNKFDGSIIDELGKAIDDGVIRVVDLLFIIKDEHGDIAAGEYMDQPGELRQSLDKLQTTQASPLLTDEDILQIGDAMDNDTAAGVLVIEHLWAKGLKQALLAADGVLIAEGRIRPERAEEAARELQTV